MYAIILTPKVLPTRGQNLIFYTVMYLQHKVIRNKNVGLVPI